MGGRIKKRVEIEKNRRLDLFLTNLQIEQEKKEQIIRYVEELTENLLKTRITGGLKLRLKT